MFHLRPLAKFTVLLLGLALSSIVACAADSDPVTDPGRTLRDHGLRATGSVYTLNSESEFHNKLADARTRYQEWNVARFRLADQLGEEQAIQQLSAEANALKQNISRLRRSMPQRGYGGRGAAQMQRMQRMQLSAEANFEQAYLNQMNQQLAQIKKMNRAPQDRKKVEDEESQRRRALIEALDELAKLAGTIDRSYHELHRSKEIDSALTSLSRSGSAKYRLGPSHDYRADLKTLQKLRQAIREAEELSGQPAMAPHRPRSKPGRDR
jgi:hypothetical protein